jgi:hypothetical protein
MLRLKAVVVLEKVDVVAAEPEDRKEPLADEGTTGRESSGKWQDGADEDGKEIEDEGEIQGTPRLELVLEPELEPKPEEAGQDELPLQEDRKCHGDNVVQWVVVKR